MKPELGSSGSAENEGVNMKERPILFSGPMVRAILEGRKTQTRRVVKPQPSDPNWVMLRGSSIDKSDETFFSCPYGPVGTKLWVRESFRLSDTYRDCACYEPCSCKNGVPIYAADFSNDPEMGPFKPSIHMPRWASRITLEVTGVRVEGLQDISEEDAKAEGMFERKSEDGMSGFGGHDGPNIPAEYTFRFAFKDLWNRINDERGFGWDFNPWVWVVEFKRIG